MKKSTKITWQHLFTIHGSAGIISQVQAWATQKLGGTISAADGKLYINGKELNGALLRAFYDFFDELGIHIQVTNYKEPGQSENNWVVNAYIPSEGANLASFGWESRELAEEEAFRCILEVLAVQEEVEA